MTDTPQTQAAAGGRSAARVAEGRAHDAQLVGQARGGDPRAFGRLFDRWVDAVYDRIVHRGFAPRDAGAIEVDVFATLWRELPDSPPPGVPFGAAALRTTRGEVIAAGSRSLSRVTGPSVEDRLTRATNPTTLAADPRAAALCWEAADVLGDRVRELLDLHYRHGMTVAEAAFVLDDDPAVVADLLAKLPVGYGHALRARILWRGGRPEHQPLVADLEGAEAFDADVVRVINRHVKECAECRGRSLTALAPIEVFAHLPLAGAVTGLKEEIAAGAAGSGVALAGSAFLKPGAADQPPDAEPVGPVFGDDERRTGRVAASLAAAASVAAVAHAAPAGATEMSSTEVDPVGASSGPAGEVGADAPAALDGTTTAAPDAGGVGFQSPEAVGTTTEIIEPATAAGQGGAGSAAASLAAAGVVLTHVGAAPPPPAPPPPPPTEVVDEPSPADKRRASERRTKLLVIGAVALAFVVLAVMVLVSRSSTSSTDDLFATDASTSTTGFRPSTTTTTAPATTTSTVPITDVTEDPAATSTTVAVGGGGGGGGPAPSVAPPAPPTTVPLELSVSFGPSPGTVALNSTGATLNWNVTANRPVTVSVSGEGVSSGAMSGSVPLCSAPGSGPCAVPGPHYYSITVSDGGQVVRQNTYPLNVTS